MMRPSVSDMMFIVDVAPHEYPWRSGLVVLARPSIPCRGGRPACRIRRSALRSSRRINLVVIKNGENRQRAPVMSRGGSHPLPSVATSMSSIGLRHHDLTPQICGRVVG